MPKCTNKDRFDLSLISDVDLKMYNKPLQNLALQQLFLLDA